jgi:hypothetical protein
MGKYYIGISAFGQRVTTSVLRALSQKKPTMPRGEDGPVGREVCGVGSSATGGVYYPPSGPYGQTAFSPIIGRIKKEATWSGMLFVMLPRNGY